MTSNDNNNWRKKFEAMMTDKDFAAKAASVVGDTRIKNTELMNKSAEDYPALSVGQQTKLPLGLASVLEMQKKQAARATMDSNDEDYSGVVDLATKLFDEERTKRANKAADEMRDANTGLKSEWDVTLENLGKLKSAADISKTYEAIISNPSLQGAVRLNANKALVKALEANPSMTQEEQQKLYNNTIDKQLQKMGEGIDKYLRGKNEVSGTAEYLIRSAANNSAFGKAMQLVAKNMGGSEGESAYQQQALADYDANKAKWWEQGLGIAGGLVLDAPLMQGIGSAANATMGRATMWGLGKAGGKALQASTVGRIATGAAVSSGTLGGYNATSALANQLMEGRFDVGEIAASAGHGFMLGALTGAMSPWLRGVSAGMGKAGKVATMTGGLATEAGIFTASELSEMDNPYDLGTIAKAFGKNVAVIGGLKLSNLPKTVKEYKQWYTEGKQSNFTDADYKTMADFAKANGYATDDAFTMSADGAYSRSIADRVTGNRTLLTMTKLQGGKEQNLAIEMYNDPNVPLSLKTKIAAKMNLPAPPPVLPNGVRVEGNKAITYYTMSNGQQQVIDIKEFDRPRKARAYANEFSRTTARRNDLLQSEASVNVMMSQPMVVARLNEQAKRNGTTLADEKARMDGILQRAADGTITQEDIAYYRSIVEDDVTTTESIKKDIKDKFGIEIDEVLNKEGNFSAAEDEALTAYGNALRTIIERGNPTTERTATAAMAGIEDYVALNNLGIEQTSTILSNPEQRAAIEQQTRSHYAAWLKYFDGRMSEDALAQKLGLDLNNTSGLQTFISEQTYFKAKAADRIAYNTAEAAKQLLEQGNGGVRFLDDGRVKLKGVPFAVEVNESIAARYEAAKQGSGEPMQRIVNDALKDIIKQSETPAEPKEPIAEETSIVEEPMTEAEAVTQQMVDARLAEIDTDLQGIDADGVQRMTINGKPVAIIKGRIIADENGQVDKTKSSAEVAYMLLDENGRPMLNEQGKPIIEVGVKPSNVRVENIEQWRSVDDYKASEEQRIRDNNRITDEAMRQVDEQTVVENQVPTEPKTADDLLAMCDGDKALALDVATDELAKAMQAKGKGVTPAETIEINKRIRMYQQMVDRLSATEQPGSTALPEVEQNEIKAEPQVTEDMEFVYQQGLDENHDGMEPMKMTDGRYKWVGLQQGELTATMGERDVELLDNLAKKLGVAVIPINVADRAVNGYYRDGNIYVNTNRGAEWTMRWVAGHEMLHDVAKKSPEAYDAYKQAVLDMWGSDYIESQVKQIIEDYKASGKNIDREQALTELVNDFGGDLFSSRDGLNILDSILKDQSSKGNTGFIDTIKKWWENIKEFFGVSPYANEVEKKLADAYKSAMENVDYQARQEQVVKDMDDAFFGESTEVAAPKQVDSELRETKDYTPTKMPRGVVVGNKESKDYSVKQIMRGVGIDAQTDGDNVWFERDGKRFDKYNPMTIEESKSGILKNMVDQCMELGLMDEAKAEDVYKMYTGIVNKIIEKADGSFADLSNQYLWLGETVYKVVHSNSDKQYKRSLDVTLVCKKNEAVIRGISELQRRQGFGVTPSQIMQLYYSTLDKGFQVPCPVCYVFSRYIQNGQYISNLIYGHHKFDKDKYFKNPAKMSAKKKAEAEQYWLDRYNEALAWEEANKKLIADAKSVLSWATKEMDMLMLDAAKGNLDKAKQNEYKERAKKLDSWYRAALDLVSQSDMSGYIKSVIANPIVKDKKVVGMAMREDAGQKMTQEVEEAILDYRKVALAKTKYPHISRYIASKGSAAGKGFNFEGDNPMGDILQQLSTDSKNYFQEAMNATSEKERNKLMKSAKDRTMAAAKYAAQQSLRGGVRQWSWSDNIEALAPDVALNAMQIGMLGGAMQTYSKQLEGIEMMAAMGAYVNGSLMGKGMGYQKVSENYSESPKWQDPNTGSWYTLAFDDVVGVQPRSLNGKLGLFALNQMYDKAGNILVGMNDIHIRTAMADPRIFFIIPWHASGMSDHILKQMNSMLKLDMAGFKASDYTKHQEEKMYKEKKESDKAEEEDDSTNVPDSTTALWRSHDYSDRFVNNDGTKANIAIEDGTLSADQLHYRELRDAIFMHSNAESAKDTDKAFWAEHQDWLAEIKNDIFLNQAYESVTDGPGRFGVAMTKDDCGFIYPYEYWDKASTFDNADINGQRYVEYCRRLGVKPKFSGVDGGSASEYGNFVDDAGYWKLLIDRRMYDRNGNYQDLTPVDASGFKADFIDQDKTSARFPVTVVADKEQTSNIVDDVQYNELKTYKKKKLKVDYKILPETAIKNAAEALMQYNQAKQLVSMTKTGKVSVKTQKELYELELERLANEEALADIENDDFMDNEGAEMSIVRDRNKIDELEGEELVPMLRTFQIFDGRLYPPMAAVQGGKKVHSVMVGDWWQSEENPGEAKVKVSGTKDEVYDKEDDRISKKDGRWVISIDGVDKPLSMEGDRLAYYFKLQKGEKGDLASDSLYARYNPYVHASKSALNDQFKGAYLRPNLVLVEILVPKSEIDGTNRYKADYAKDGIGFVPWNSGDVIKQAVAAGHPGREVALSRYAKIGRVFSNAEWADHIDAELAPYKDKIVLPFVMFPPEVLRGLANKGYKIEPPTSKKAQPYYEAWLKGEQPTDPNGGGGKPIDAEFSIKADKELEKKSLVGVHNLTEDNLRYALNLGGLANPSTAVIDKNIMGLEGFGDISLIMPKSLVAKSTGKNAGTFAGDAYTPRFPKGDVVKYITKEGEKAIMADYPGDDKFNKDFREAWQSYGNEYGGITPALYYMYKLENGGAKIVKAEAPKIKSKEHQRMIDKFGNKEWYELNDAEKRELVDYRKSEMIESLKGADKNMVDKVVNDFINSADPEDLAYKKLRMLKMDYKEQQRAGEIDYMATYRNAQDDVALAGEQAKFNKWLADKSKRYGIEDRIFRGYTASGNRKYAPMTLANISKVMKEQGRAGAETFMTKSAYSLRGKMLPVYKTLEQIKKNKSKLSDTETYEKFRKEIGDEYNELILDISELPNVKYDDTHYILEDALLKGFDYAEKQAGVQISDAVRERISAFGNLLKEAPVKYFETKFERPVMFDEFVAAVVPKNINPELRKALADKGLAIEEYERGSEESRLEAVRRASDRDDVQFSVKGKRADESVLDYAKRMSEETGKKNLLNANADYSIKQPKDAEYEAKEQWRKGNAGAIASSFFADRRADKVTEVEQLKKKISELKADNTKAASEDKAKVREIADEMHAYIKKNIPTENQGDMTRQQFESVLKQLETAVTKQELEKPMQMVEYIGANVARRALTRQMRDFVKNGFKALTPKGLAKPKTVDGVTSRVLGLVKTLYQAMNKNAFGSDLYKLQKQVREEKAKLEQFNADNGGKYKDVVDKVNEILAKTGIDRYEEMYKFFDEKQATGDVDGEVLGYIGRMLPLLDSIELTKDQQKQAKADSAIVTKEDLDQLRTSLEEKRDKGILSEEDKAVLDNMPLYEAMLSLHQQQLNIDGPGASSLAMQMKAKVDEIKSYSKGLDGVTDENGKTAIRIKTQIKEANNELQELFAARIVDQKAVNANVGELLDNLKEIRDTGKSKLQEWSKAKQERATRLVKMANESFGKDAKGYWSEVDKRGKLKKDFINWANNLRLSVLMSPAMSFEYMLGVMDPRYYTNNSPIYKQFIKSSEGLIKANDNFFEGTESYNMAVNEAVERFINRNAMTNLKEYFRRGDRFATAIIPFEVKVSRNGVDEYIPKEEMMTRGQAAKIYAWSRMADGMAKLKAHGVTDNTLTKVKEFIGEDYMNFIDWVEDEFFPRLRRERYNPVYKQMYGISMAENDHYFPFLIYQKDVRTEQELEVSNNDTLGGGVVGNLVERKRNNARLDFTAKSPDIFDMITDYGKKMEEWAAYAQVREDLKKVINDKQFKQHCDELGTHYYKYFLEAAQVASRLSRDMAMTQHTQSGWAKAQKTIASAAISLRVSTALKQLLSAPAFMVYSLDPAFHHELIKTVQPIDVESAIKGLWKLAEGDMGEAKKLLLDENWVGHYNWCVENLPSFRERVTLKGAGNPILEEKGFFKFADDIQSVGMLPNRLVDAFTCSVGAKAIYEYAYKKYRKNYSEKTAHNMAVTDAEIAFNSSQQSSNPVFLAPMQVSKQFLLRGMMNYKNSPIGYYRNAMKASIDMYRATKAIFGQPKFTINGEVYGFENDGKNPFAMAAESGARASMFWLFLNLIWNFGTVGVAGLSYTMLNGSKNDDGNMLYTDEEIKKALGNDMGWALFNASNQGIPWVSGFSSAAQTGQDYTPSILFSEMNNYVEQINKDGFMSMATAQIFTDLLLKNAAGVDPEVWGQIYRGAQGIMEDRPMRIEDFMNLIASPRSAISGVTKQRVGEYDRLRDYVNDRIKSNRQLGVDERMTFGKKLTGMRELSKKSLGMYVDEYLADKIPGYREFANKPTEMEKEEEVANSNTLNAASSLYETIVRKEEEKDEKKNKIKDPEIKSTARLLTTAANVIHRLCEVNDFETAERIANEMERIIKRDYNPNGKTIEERLKNVDVWDSTGTTEQPSADGYNTAFERAIDGGFASYLRRGKD